MKPVLHEILGVGWKWYMGIKSKGEEFEIKNIVRSLKF
jgi:hypothetical protein